MKGIFRRIAWLGRRSRFDAELDDEIQFHLEARADELERAGLSRREALAQARREFGSTARMREDTRSAWQFRWLADLGSDLRYAGRSFRRNPAFAATAIACLALGIGANTTIFSIATEVLFSEPSCRDPRTLLVVEIGGSSHSPLREYRFIRDARIFEGLTGLNEDSEANWRYGDRTYRVFGARITENFFQVVGAPVALGRPIEPGDSEAVVLTYRFWQGRLGGDPNILGRKLVLDGKPFTVAGVLPRDHRTLTGFGFSPDVYLPAESGIVRMYARVAQG